MKSHIALQYLDNAYRLGMKIKSSKLRYMRKSFIFILLALFILNVQTACSSEPDENGRNLTDADGNNPNLTSTKMNITIDNHVLEVALVDNSATRALVKRLQEGNISYSSSSYGNFETVGNIGFSLPTSNSSITTQAGDVILYQGNQICIFYGSNSWSYTRLGRISNASEAGLRSLLSSGTVNITLSLADNDATGVSTVKSESGAKNSKVRKGIYTLTGEKLAKAPQKGLYIEDGVKKAK